MYRFSLVAVSQMCQHDQWFQCCLFFKTNNLFILFSIINLFHDHLLGEKSFLLTNIFKPILILVDT